MAVDDVTAAILVGGRARRLDGQVKPALQVGGRSILDRQLAALREAGIDEIMLVGTWRGSHGPRVRQVPDLVQDCGALGALYSALLFAVTPVVVVLAGDLPFVGASLVAALSQVEPAEDAAVPRSENRRHPLCAAYRRRVAGLIKRRLDRGALRVTDALDDMRVREITGEALGQMNRDGMLLMNVNTPADHDAAERYARSRP